MLNNFSFKTNTLKKKKYFSSKIVDGKKKRIKKVKG